MDGKTQQLFQKCLWRNFTESELEKLSSRSVDASFRKELAEIDWEFFCKYYLAEHFTKPFANMHWEMAEDFSEALESESQVFEVIAFPREFGKTTWVSLAFVLYCILYQKRRYIIPLSQAYDQAKDYLSDIKAELEGNERIIDDFGDLRGTPWQASEIRTSTGVRVKPLGSRMKLRGRKERWQRPDLIIADDLEDVVTAKNEAERKAKKNWVMRTVLKAGTDNTVFFFVGNKIHEDGVIAMLLDNPLFIKREYKAVTSWAQRQDLWDEWRRILTRYPKDSQRGKHEARKFYVDHRQDMDLGAVSSWPEGKSYYDLMVMLVVGGRTAFFAEMQNEPQSDEDRVFKFDEYRLVSTSDGDVALIPLNGNPSCRLKDCLYFMSVDPSLGKISGDPSAIVVVALSPTGHLFVLVADIAFRTPYHIIQDLIRYHTKYPTQRCAVEVVQFQALFATDAARESAAQGAYINFVQLTPKTNKTLRIQGLEPAVAAGYILLPEFGVDQLKHEALNWPNVSHEDGLDALELCYQIVQSFEASKAPQIIEGESMIAGDGKLFAPDDANEALFDLAERLAHDREVALALNEGREPPKEQWWPIMRY